MHFKIAILLSLISVSLGYPPSTNKPTSQNPSSSSSYASSSSPGSGSTSSSGPGSSSTSSSSSPSSSSTPGQGRSVDYGYPDYPGDRKEEGKHYISGPGGFPGGQGFFPNFPPYPPHMQNKYPMQPYPAYPMPPPFMEYFGPPPVPYPNYYNQGFKPNFYDTFDINASRNKPVPY